MIYACRRCDFVFERKATTQTCPNCGRDSAQPASEKEQTRYINTKAVATNAG